MQLPSNLSLHIARFATTNAVDCSRQIDQVSRGANLINLQ